MNRTQAQVLDTAADAFLVTAALILTDVAGERIDSGESDDADLVARLADGVIEPVRGELTAMVEAGVSGT